MSPRNSPFLVYISHRTWEDATVIPAKVIAKISLRIVPDQDLKVIKKSLHDHLVSSFKGIKSPNKLAVRRMSPHCKVDIYSSLRSTSRMLQTGGSETSKATGSRPSNPQLEKNGALSLCGYVREG